MAVTYTLQVNDLAMCFYSFNLFHHAACRAIPLSSGSISIILRSVFLPRTLSQVLSLLWLCHSLTKSIVCLVTSFISDYKADSNIL